MHALVTGGVADKKEALKVPSIQGNLDWEPLHVGCHAVNVTNGNQISRSFSGSADSPNYTDVSVGMVCWMSQKLQIMTFFILLHLLPQYPLCSFNLLPLPLAAFLVITFWACLDNEIKIIIKTKTEKKNQSMWNHISKNWSRNLSSKESCTASRTHLPLVMDLCNYFPAMLAGCYFPGRTSHTEFLFFALWNWDRNKIEDNVSLNPPLWIHFYFSLLNFCHR